MRISKPVWVLLVVLALLFLYLPSLSHYFKLRHQEEKLNREIKEMTERITSLKEEEHLIRHDLAHLEKVVRQELGLVQPGEVVYKLVPEDQLTAPAPGNQTESIQNQADQEAAKVIQLKK
ncbi:MAG: hypothetical protein COV74_07230 [Candidatus Omnitrophica bacterium CG11_big_fil_rev_8_21_14_0_20_45_26]|uniref:Septum formation initiator n=1 Tax=Candidatus Abzuiibacterium crystallinum TaxID=1974748 RepID=A0A2H0LN56_9BACT|nr:MAG: hypothetical protein COV74_07230 [Candidatus Omnitrophica bacterium CG11_big_fil_rev_8_21_14_0_20_45_26]PIW65492.1 MAG: hypothetical protein COW12_01490 [Candidatus Omnitrophica bacterium CG12_big_fil_rev_8_21_14_0_65_45_16]